MSQIPMRAILTAILAFSASGLAAFGPFKMRTGDFDWRILSTPHFDIYFYPEEEELARRAALIAEKGYHHNSRVLDYYARAKFPLFLFQSHVEFQQTNISRGPIGPGTGGFTEGFKNRMVLPTTQSDRWLETVIIHELAHAVQFDILYGEGARSFQVYKNYVIPLWVMEGMAEYCARNWDTYADMVMRDAVVNDRLPDLDLLDGFSHLDEVYVAYKAGQTAIQHLSDTQGPESVSKLMKKYKAQISTWQIFRDLTGKSFGQFNREWKSSLRQKYWLQSRGKKAISHYARPLTWDTSEDFTTSNGPSWAPDGKRFAFVSTRSAREEIWVADLDGKEMRPLFSGPFQELGRSGGYGVPGGRLSWSPDGRQLAFVVVEDGVKKIRVGDVRSKRMHDIGNGYREVAAPAFSPDGKKIAFSASQGGRTEIKVLELSSGKQHSLPHEEGWSLVTDPAWSPDSKWIAFSAEVARKNQVFVSAATGAGKPRLLSKPGVDSLQPAFSDGGNKVIFSTEEGGAYNLAQVQVSADAAPSAKAGPEILTEVLTGVFSPKVSPDGSKMLLVGYEDGCQNLYVMDTPGFVREPPSAELRLLINPYLALAKSVSPAAGELAPPSDLAPPGANLDIPVPDLALNTASSHYLDASSLTLSASDLSYRPYKLKISPDLFFVLLGFDNINGLIGGGYLTASDMLGAHNLSLFVNFVPGYQSVVQGDYLLYHGRWDISLAAFYRNTNFFLSQINPQQFSSTFLDQDWGGSLIAAYPFSNFSRVEFGLGSRRLFRQLNGDANLDPELRATLGLSYINSASVSLVRDALRYKNFEPYGGTRAVLNNSYSDKFLGGTRNFVFHQLDLRWYLPLNFLSRDAVIGGRILGLEQTGEDRHLFYFGGAQVRGLSYNEYLGQKIGMANIQIRHPYLKNINGTLWPFDSLLIKDAQLVLFYDVGVAPLHWDKVEPTDFRAGYGGGFRLHTFMFEKVLLNFAFDVAQRTDKPGFTYYYFTLGQIF